MFNEIIAGLQGLAHLVTTGDYTGALNGIGIAEDNPLVDFILRLQGR